MFTRTVINHHDDNTRTIYTCPHCDGSITLSINDFDKHWDSCLTNLKGEDFIGAPYGKGFLDFYCPVCAAPTTVRFKLEAGGRRGDKQYTIEKPKQQNAL